MSQEMRPSALTGASDSEALRHVVLMGARLRDDGRNQDQEGPHVGERIGHPDQSSAIKHKLGQMELTNYRFVTGRAGLALTA